MVGSSWSGASTSLGLCDISGSSDGTGAGTSPAFCDAYTVGFGELGASACVWLESDEVASDSDSACADTSPGPCVVGSGWSGANTPPEVCAAGELFDGTSVAASPSPCDTGANPSPGPCDACIAGFGELGTSAWLEADDAMSEVDSACCAVRSPDAWTVGSGCSDASARLKFWSTGKLLEDTIAGVGILSSPCEKYADALLPGPWVEEEIFDKPGAGTSPRSCESDGLGADSPPSP